MSDEDTYARILRDAHAEIERFTGGIISHVAWFEKNHPNGHHVFLHFIEEIGIAVKVQLPLAAFKTLVDLFIASNRHVWTLWLVRDDLRGKPPCPFPPGYGDPN